MPLTHEEFAKRQQDDYTDAMEETLEALGIPRTASTEVILSTLYALGWAHGYDWAVEFPDD